MLLKCSKNLSIILQGQSRVRQCGVPQYMMQLCTSKVRTWRCQCGVIKKGMSCKCMPTYQGERTNLQYTTQCHHHERSNNQKWLYIPYHNFVMSQDVHWVFTVEGKRWKRRSGSGRVWRRLANANIICQQLCPSNVCCQCPWRIYNMLFWTHAVDALKHTLLRPLMPQMCPSNVPFKCMLSMPSKVPLKYAWSML